MAKPVEIWIEFKQKNPLIFKTMGRAMNLLSSSIKATFRTAIVASFFLAIRQGVKTFNDLKNSLKGVISEYAKLHDTARLTAAVMSKGREGFQVAFEGIKTFAADAAASSRFSMQQIEDGLFTTAIAGYKLGDAMNITKLGLDMAVISGTEFNSVIGGLISTTKAFGVETGNMKAMAEVMTAAFTSSKMTLMDFFNAMKYVAPAAVTAFGESEQTFRDVTAALSTLHDVGLSASKAGIYTRSAVVKLMAPTPKIMEAFSRYGVNPYEASGDSAKYVDTMLKSMKATGELSKKVTELKDKQFELAIAGKQGSSSFTKLTEELGEAQNKLQILEGGLSRVKKEFDLAGGKMIPFSKILDELSQKVPTEVVMRAFGVRSGQGITALLNKMETYRDKISLLEKVEKEANTGKSIIDDMLTKIAQSVLHKWLMIKNTMLSSFSPIFTAIAQGFSPVLDSILAGLTTIKTWIKTNQSLFINIFTTMGDSLNKVISDALPKLENLMNKLGSTKNVTAFTQYSYSEGGIVSEQKETKNNLPEYQATIMSIGSLLRASIAKAFDVLKPQLEAAALIFSEVFFSQLQLGFSQIATILSSLASTFGKQFSAGILRGLTDAGGSILKKITAFSPIVMVSNMVNNNNESKKGSLNNRDRMEKTTVNTMELSQEQIMGNVSGILKVAYATLNATKGVNQSTRQWEIATDMLINTVHSLKSRTDNIESKVRTLSRR